MKGMLILGRVYFSLPDGIPKKIGPNKFRERRFPEYKEKKKEYPIALFGRY